MVFVVDTLPRWECLKTLGQGTYSIGIYYPDRNCSVDLSEEYQLLTTSSNEIPEEVFNIFPNPADHQISILGGADLQAVEIFDLTGRLVKNAVSNVVDISDLASGLHTVRIYYNKNKEAHYPLVIR